jgi:hypothetical protein
MYTHAPGSCPRQNNVSRIEVDAEQPGGVHVATHPGSARQSAAHLCGSVPGGTRVIFNIYPPQLPTLVISIVHERHHLHTFWCSLRHRGRRWAQALKRSDGAGAGGVRCVYASTAKDRKIACCGYQLPAGDGGARTTMPNLDAARRRQTRPQHPARPPPPPRELATFRWSQELASATRHRQTSRCGGCSPRPGARAAGPWRGRTPASESGSEPFAWLPLLHPRHHQQVSVATVPTACTPVERRVRARGRGVEDLRAQGVVHEHS